MAGGSRGSGGWKVTHWGRECQALWVEGLEPWMLSQRKGPSIGKVRGAFLEEVTAGAGRAWEDTSE